MHTNYFKTFSKLKSKFWFFGNYCTLKYRSNSSSGSYDPRPQYNDGGQQNYGGKEFYNSGSRGRGNRGGNRGNFGNRGGNFGNRGDFRGGFKRGNFSS